MFRCKCVLARLLDGDRVLRMLVDAVRNVMHYVNIPEYGVCLRCKMTVSCVDVLGYVSAEPRVYVVDVHINSHVVCQTGTIRSI